MSFNIIGINESGKILTLTQDVVLESTFSLNGYSKLDFAGHKMTGPSGAYALEITDGSKVEICNGTLVTDNRGIYACGASHVTLGDKFVFEGKMRAVGIYDGSSLVMDAGASINTKGGDVNIFICGDLTIGKVKGPNRSRAEIAGTVVNTENFCISGNGRDTTGCDLVIKSPADLTSSDIAIYFPCLGDFLIEGGSISGNTAVYVKSGIFRILGGTLTGKGEKKEYTPSNNGANSTGDAVVIDSCNYPSGAPTVEITGGVFVSKSAEAVGSYADGDEAVAKDFIKGGSFTPEVSKGLVSPSSIVVSGKVVEVQYLDIDFSSRQSSTPNEDGSSILITYLDAHVSYKVPGLVTGRATVEIQELVRVTMNPEGLKTSIVDTPAKFSSVDEVLAIISEKVNAHVQSEQISRQERATVQESMSRMKLLGL